jgi:hypothetical protein
MKVLLFVFLSIVTSSALEAFDVEAQLFLSNGGILVSEELDEVIPDASSGLGYDLGVGFGLWLLDNTSFHLGVLHWSMPLNTAFILIEGEYILNEKAVLSYSGLSFYIKQHLGRFFYYGAGIDYSLSVSSSADIKAYAADGNMVQQSRDSESIYDGILENIVHFYFEIGYEIKYADYLFSPVFRISPGSTIIFDPGVSVSTQSFNYETGQMEESSYIPSLTYFMTYKIGLIVRKRFD